MITIIEEQVIVNHFDKAKWVLLFWEMLRMCSCVVGSNLSYKPVLEQHRQWISEKVLVNILFLIHKTVENNKNNQKLYRYFLYTWYNTFFRREISIRKYKRNLSSIREQWWWNLKTFTHQSSRTTWKWHWWRQKRNQNKWWSSS